MARSPELSPEPASPTRANSVAGGGLAQSAPEHTTIVTERRTVPREARLSGRRWRRTSRWLGLIIFLMGAVLLAYVFVEALRGFQRFAQPDYLSMQLRQVEGGGWVEPLIAAVATFGSEFLRVLYLLLLGYLASAIAAKGIQFFAASEAVIDEAVTADIDEEISD